MPINLRYRFSFINIIVILLLRGFTAHTQTIPVLHYTKQDGLPSNTVYSIYSDSKGYLWFASDKGIARYNGHEFKTFSIADGLPDNEIFGFREDYENRLWFSTFNGELCYYKDNTFHTAANAPWLKLPFKTLIINLNLERDSSITIQFGDSKKFVNIDKNKLRIIYLEKAKKTADAPGHSVRYIVKENSNLYSIYATPNFFQIDSSGNLLNFHAYKNGREYWSSKLNDQNCLCNSKGIYSLNEKLIYLFQKPIDFLEHAGLYSINGDYLLYRKDGLYLKDTSVIIKNIFAASIINNISKNMWISARENGAYILSKNFKDMKTWLNAYEGKVQHAKILNNVVHFVTDNESWFSIHNNKIQGTFKEKIRDEDKKAIQYSITKNGDYVSMSRKNSYVAVAPGGVYQKRKIYILNNTSEHGAKAILETGRVLYKIGIYSIFKTDYQSLIQGKAVIDTLLNEVGVHRIFAQAINPMDSSLWFSRADGIFQIKGIQIFSQPLLKRNIFRQFGFYDHYLVGFTDKNKLLIYSNYNNNNFTLDSVSDKNCIWENIYPIDNHRAIISTNNHYRLLTLYTPTTSGKPRYNIQAIEDPFVPEQAEYIVADSNNCYFFKEGTITQIKTEILFEKTPAPVPVFSSFKTQNKTYPVRPEIKINYNESRTINISFDNISFAGKDIACQYSISDNGHDNWREISGNEINLNTPGYGTYIIKIRSKTLASGYSRPAVLKLDVQKPFWATWWFIGICVLVFIALVWCIVLFVTWRRLRKKQKEHDADMKYQQSEYKALNALMNPHFIFNSLNNIQGLINRDEKRTANQYLVIFSDLVRQNMHNISKGFISLQEELTLIENYLTLEKLRFKELVNYRIKVEEEIDIDGIMIPPLMIQPLVENAVKHGLLPRQSASSMVTIDVYEKEDILYVIIEDNGIGLTESLKSENRLHDSFGLSNLQKRTEHLKKIQQHEISIDVLELKDTNGIVTGTRAVVTIKLE